MIKHNCDNDNHDKEILLVRRNVTVEWAASTIQHAPMSFTTTFWHQVSSQDDNDDDIIDDDDDDSEVDEGDGDNNDVGKCPKYAPMSFTTKFWHQVSSQDDNDYNDDNHDKQEVGKYDNAEEILLSYYHNVLDQAALMN